MRHHVGHLDIASFSKDSDSNLIMRVMMCLNDLQFCKYLGKLIDEHRASEPFLKDAQSSAMFYLIRMIMCHALEGADILRTVRQSSRLMEVVARKGLDDHLSAIEAYWTEPVQKEARRKMVMMRGQLIFHYNSEEGARFTQRAMDRWTQDNVRDNARMVISFDASAPSVLIAADAVLQAAFANTWGFPATYDQTKVGEINADVMALQREVLNLARPLVLDFCAPLMEKVDPS